MKRISIINFKGGVGKTTLSLHLACFLSRENRVLLIDVDHQSSLSIVILGETLWPECVAKGKTINRVFESFCNPRLGMPDNSIVTSNPFYERYERRRNNFYPNLDFVSAQFELDDTEIDLASTNYGNPMLSEWEKRTLLCRWLDSISAQETYEYVIFDCPPATKIVSQNALTASDSYIIPVIPEDISSRGVTHFRNLVETKIDERMIFFKNGARISDQDTPYNYIPRTRLAGIVPFLVRYAGNAASGYTNIHTEQLAALRRRWGTDVIDTEGQHYTGIAEAVNAGRPVWNYQANNVTPAVKIMMEKICQQLKDRVDQ